MTNSRSADLFSKYSNILIFAVPLVFYAMGFFIHNNYLSKYGVANYDLIKGKYIYVGFIFMIIFLLAGFLLIIQTSLSKLRINFNKHNLFLWFFRFETILLIYYNFFPGKDKSKFITTDLTVFGLFRIPEKHVAALSAGLISFMYLWFILSIALKGEQPEEEEKRVDLYGALVLFIPTNFLIIWGLLFNKLFLNIFLFLGLFFIFIMALFWGCAHRISLPHLKSRFFKEKLSDHLRMIEERIYAIIMVLPMLIVLASTYSRTIYKELPNNFGGAKPIRAILYYLDSKSIKGDLIDETSDRIIIKCAEENRIIVVNRQSLKELEILKENLANTDINSSSNNKLDGGRIKKTRPF